MNPSVFLRAAELQDEQNRDHPNWCNYSCWNVQAALGKRKSSTSPERTFYKNLFGCSGNIFELLSQNLGYKYHNENELRVLTLLLAYEVAKDKRRAARRKTKT